MRHHLYVCPSDSPELRRHIAFRNYLRSRPAAAAEYAALKKELAMRCGNDIDAYVEGKTEFVLRCLGAEK